MKTSFLAPPTLTNPRYSLPACCLKKAKLMALAGFKIIAIVEYDGTIYNEKGLDIRALAEHRKKTGSITEFPEGQGLSRDEGLYLETDVLMPAALADLFAHDFIRHAFLAGTGVAMGNAIDSVKQIAQFVTKTNMEDGVAHAIEELVL